MFTEPVRILTQVFDASNYTASLYALPTAVTTAGVLTLGILALVRERWQMVSLSFFLASLAIATWLFSFTWMYCATSPQVALWWAKAAYVGVPFIAPAMLHFTVAVLGIYDRHRRFVWISWGVAACFMVIGLATDWMVAGLSQYWWGYYPRYGWIGIPYLTFFFGIMALTMGHYWVAYRRASAGTTHRRRVLALLVAFHVVYLGSFDYLAKFGIPIYPFGYLPVGVFLILVARAIHRYRLVGLSPAFAAKEIIDAMGSALLVVDSAGVVRIVNRVACELFRRPEAHLVGRSLTSVDPSLAPLTSSEMPREPAYQMMEFSLMNGVGVRKNLSATASVMYDHAGASIATVWIINDVTARKQAEEQLRSAHEELQRSHSALEATQLQLVRAAKLESVGRLAAGVAHEVKNPLAIILMGAEYLSKHLTNGNPDTRTVLDDLRDAVRRADTVIRGLLDFASVQAVEMQRESLNPIVEQALLLVKHELDKAHITVVSALNPQLPPCRVDPSKIEQVFVNLFLNAIQAMPEGGTLTVRTLTRHLTQVGPRTGMRTTDRFKVGETVVEADVEDTGPGVAPEHLPKLFDPFFTTKPTGAGTGLGLAVSRNIVDLHGGDLYVENLPTRGVRVSLLLKLEGGGGNG